MLIELEILLSKETDSHTTSAAARATYHAWLFLCGLLRLVKQTLDSSEMRNGYSLLSPLERNVDENTLRKRRHDKASNQTPPRRALAKSWSFSEKFSKGASVRHLKLSTPARSYTGDRRGKERAQSRTSSQFQGSTFQFSSSPSFASPICLDSPTIIERTQLADCVLKAHIHERYGPRKAI